MDEALSQAHGGVLGRPHIAALLVKKGVVKTIKQIGGTIKHDPKFPMPTLANLKVFPTDEYYRKPPFAPVEG